jgi:opacity protein-like surface antigen
MTIQWLKQSVLFGSISFLLFFLCSPASGFAEEHPIGISVAFRYASLVGDEESGFKWSDLYDNGIGGSLELSYRTNPAVAILGGISYDKFAGADITLCCPAISGKFSDQNPLTFYLGAKLFLLQTSGPSTNPADPYIRLDLGMTQFDKVEFEGITVGDAVTKFGWDIGLGVDVSVSPVVGYFIEIKYQDYGKPDQAGETLRAIPISVGIRYSP